MKRIYKKAMSILLAAIMICGTLAFGVLNVDWADFSIKAEAEDIVGGTCGENLTWTLGEKTNTLTISGTGNMDDFFLYNMQPDSPWDGYSTQIKTINIESGVASIGNYAFYYFTNATSITIPESTTKIGSNAFLGCTSLENVYYLGDIASWAGKESGAGSAGTSPMSYASNLYVDGELVSGDITIPDSVSCIGNYAFYGCDKITNINLPDKLTSIGEGAFSGCTKMEKLLIPNNVTKIGHGAFKSCTSLKEIDIPDSVTNLEWEAFKLCDSIEKIELSKNITEISQGLFSGCSKIKEIHIPQNVTEIKYQAFMDCLNLKEITIPKSVVSIGGMAFDNCNNITDIYYCGSEKEWNAITIGFSNESLSNATIHYNCVSNDEPSTTKPTTVPTTELTTKLNEPTIPSTTEPTTTKPAVTEPSTTKPTEPSTTKPSETAKEELIKKPSTTEVKYGETLILHADFANIPADAKIEWSVEGKGVEIKPSADGKTCAVTSTATGDATVTAKYVDANGVEHVSEQEIESNASLWQKIVSFFKNLFRINRTIEQAVKFTF